MRARYYSPEMKRFINADIVAGSITNAVTLNRFAYANGNPVSFVDPFGLSAERQNDAVEKIKSIFSSLTSFVKSSVACLKKEIEKLLKEIFAVQYKVPLYEQGRLSLCWAYSQVMIESYREGITLTQEEANQRVRELAIQVNGEDDWNRGAWPTNMGEAVNPDNLFELYWILKNEGPVYGYYWNGKKDGDAHLIVVTGVDLLNKTVSTNNPWGSSGKQTFQEFKEGVLGSDSTTDMPYYFLLLVSKEE